MFEVTQRMLAVGFVLGLALASLLTTQADGEEPPEKLVGLREPVFRVTKQELPVREVAKQHHPLDPALEIANRSLTHIRKELVDYKAILIKRERIGGELGEQQFMLAKIRNEKRDENGLQTPFSVYLRFLKPEAIKGREVIYVAGKNNGSLIAHEGGWKGKVTPSIPLNPNGPLAMMGQRYPITDIGIENLCVKLIERGTRDKKLGDCVVQIQPAKINKRPCTRIQVKHPKQLPHLDFHLARIFVDDEYNVPIRYEAYDWPTDPAGNVTQDDLIEEYTYVQLEVNPGLSDRDFDPANPDYNME